MKVAVIMGSKSCLLYTSERVVIVEMILKKVLTQKMLWNTYTFEGEGILS